MASHSLPSGNSDSYRPLDFRQENIAIQIAQSNASTELPGDIQDNFTNNDQLRGNQEEPNADSTLDNEKMSNTESLDHQIRPNPAMSLSRSVSQETAPSFSSSTRKTPFRAVFNDLPTAYLSITSKFGRSRSQNTSGSFLGVHSEDDSISLQDPQPPTLPDTLPHSQPLSPVAVAPANYHSHNLLDRALADEQNQALVTQHVGQGVSDSLDREPAAAVLLTGVKDLLHVASFSDIKGEAPVSAISSQSAQEATHPHFTNESGKSIRHKTPDIGTDSNGSTFMHQGSSPQRKPSHALPAPEESTVNNIYRHYASSSIGGWDSENGTLRLDPDSRHHSCHLPSSNGLSTGSRLDYQAKPSALTVRKQRRVDRLMTSPPTGPPSYALPSLPTLNPNHTAASMSQGLENSSSYGDTKNLLEITQRPNLTIRKATLSRSNGRTDLRLQEAGPGSGANIELNATTSISRNPFRHNSHPPDITPSSNVIDCVYDDDHNSEVVSGPRPPLERDVSQALRRASGFSVFSTGSASSSFFHGEAFGTNGLSFKSTTFNKTGGNNDTGKPNTLGEVAAGAQGFYNDHAIPSSWVTPHQQSNVRVPINRNKMFTNSTPEPGVEPSDMPLGRQDDMTIDDLEGDANDWETVGDSRFGAEFKDSRDTGGIFELSTIHRTGSSVANTSNDGTSSIYDAESDAYGSTERIIQHPGTIQYSSDYRERDINMSPTPVFPPMYREHKVNGYLAGLTQRNPPSSPFSHTPQPLGIPHTNPFRSSPPENLPTPTARRLLFQKHRQRVPKPNHFPPPTKTVPTTKDDGLAMEDTGSISSALTPTTLAERDRTYRNLNRNAESAYPSPALSHSKRQFLSPINPVGRPDRPSSWRHLMVFGRGDKVEGYNADGTLDSGSSAWAQTESTDSNFHTPIQGDGSIELGRYPGRRRSTNPREHQPLVKGPPGAFYQGIARSQKDASPANSFDALGRSAKVTPRYASPKDYPTNVLRPLSLLGNGPTTPAGSENIDPLSDTRLTDSGYHSPHAPPRRLSWQQLYTEAQLKTMEEAAMAHSLYDVSLAPNTDQRTRAGSTHRQLYDGSSFNQQLNSWTREESARIDRLDRQTKLSNLFLLFCAFVPPLLLLFSLGYLDRIITWWSKGEVSAFGRKQKRLAQVLVAVYGFAIFVGLILILVFRFAPSKKSAT